MVLPGPAGLRPPASPPRSRPPTDRFGHGSAPGTCGELVQGVTSAGEHFTVTCPIERSAYVRVRLRSSPSTRVIGRGEQSSGDDRRRSGRSGQDRWKMALAARWALHVLGAPPHEVQLEHRSDLDVGKGLGSSTADITATVRAVAAAYATELAPEQIAAIATSIEPSDGSMYPGVNAVVRDTGHVLRRFAWSPRFAIAMVVPPTTFDTDAADLSGRRGLAAGYDELLHALEEAARRRDTQAFAAQATASAMWNEAFVPNPYHELLTSMLPRSSAVGLVVGHTGTVAGLLFDADADARGAGGSVQTARALRARLPASVRVEVVASPPPPASSPAASPATPRISPPGLAQ